MMKMNNFVTPFLTALITCTALSAPLMAMDEIEEEKEVTGSPIVQANEAIDYFGMLPKDVFTLLSTFCDIDALNKLATTSKSKNEGTQYARNRKAAGFLIRTQELRKEKLHHLWQLICGAQQESIRYKKVLSWSLKTLTL